VIVGAVAWLVVSAPPALAQAAGQPAGAVVVQVGDVDPPVDRGVLVRTGDASPAPALAVLVGLSVVGATLAAITAHAGPSTRGLSSGLPV